MRYYMLDKVTELVLGERACGVKNITLTEEVLHDHFPDYPIFPGALIIEAAAQLAGFLVEMGQPSSAERPMRRALLVQIDRAKFRGLTGPGDQLLIEATILSQMQTAAQVKVLVRSGERRIANAELTFALKCIDRPAIHEQRRRIYRIWTRDLKLPPEIELVINAS